MEKANTKEILELERRYWTAIQNRDVDAALELTDDTCLVSGASGVASIDKKTFAQMMQSSRWSLKRFDFQGEPNIRFLNDDVAVLGYKIREELTVEDKPLTLDAAETSTWVRRNGEWRCVQHSESLPGDSFGRDRVETRPSAGLSSATAVANVAVRDLEKAKTFYRDVLGLTPLRLEGDEAVAFKSGNNTLQVYRSQYAGTNQATSVTWVVDDVAKSVEALKAKGVTFEHYELPEMKREGDLHIGGDMTCAWFKDPDGNILHLLGKRGSL